MAEGGRAKVEGGRAKVEGGRAKGRGEGVENRKMAGNLKTTKKASQPASPPPVQTETGIESAVRPASPPGRDRTRDMGTYTDPSPALPLSYWWLVIFGEKTTINTTSSSFV